MSRLAPVVLMMCVAGCNGTSAVNWQENPARACMRAELAGNVAVATYFASNKDAGAEAQRIVNIIDTVKALIAKAPTELPSGGFMALMPVVEAKLRDVLTGDAQAFLPSARLLVLMLLQELQLRATEGHWLDAAPEHTAVVVNMVESFLRGARDAAAVYTPSP